MLGKLFMKKNKKEEGSLELIVLCLLGALIVVLCIPMITKLGTSTNTALNSLDNAVTDATN